MVFPRQQADDRRSTEIENELGDLDEEINLLQQELEIKRAMRARAGHHIDRYDVDERESDHEQDRENDARPRSERRTG